MKEHKTHNAEKIDVVHKSKDIFANQKMFGLSASKVVTILIFVNFINIWELKREHKYGHDI